MFTLSPVRATWPAMPREELEHSQAPKRVPLPPARVGDPQEWAPGQALPPRTKRGSSTPSERVIDSRHPLLAGAAELFSVGWLTDSGRLRPRKQNIADIFTSKGTLPRALDCANALYLLLEEKSYAVRLGDGRQSRPDVDHREKPGKALEPWRRETWSPGRITVTHVDGTEFGLTIYELSESVEVDLLDSEWVRVTEIPPAKRRRWRGVIDTPVMKDLPSGRLALRVYAPGVEWQREWRETKAGELRSKFATIVRALESAIPEVQELLAESKRQAEIRHREWEEQTVRWRKKEAERKRREAFKAAREELFAIIEEWALAKRVEDFFADIERRGASLDGSEGGELTLRLARARQMLGGTDALERFRGWVSADERLEAVGRPAGSGLN